MKKIILILMALTLSGCVLDQVLKAGESGSKSYETVKNANSLGDVATSLRTVTDSVKIKAETSKDFVKGIEMLISNQSLKSQEKLISQSIAAKVSIEDSRIWARWSTVSSFWLVLFGLIIILKYLFDRWKPEVLKTTVTNK